MSRFYTVKEASLILGFSTNSIYKFLDEGRLKSHRGNSQTGRFKIPHSSLEKFLGTPLSEAAINAALAEQTLTSTQIKKENPAFSPSTPKLVVNPARGGTGPTPSEPAAADTPLPLRVIRTLIIVGLLLILGDVLVSQDLSLFQQLLRLAFMGILIVLTYQFGGLSHSM